MSEFIEQLDIIKARAATATPGPWAWFGNTGVQSVYLATQYWGRHYVMGFERWGMRGAMPRFFKGRQTDLNENGIGRFDGGVPSTPKTDPIYEVAPLARDAKNPKVYREDIIGIRNPDADFIAHSRADIDYLIGEVDRLSGIVAGGVLLAGSDLGEMKQVGWFCEHRYGTPTADTHMGWDYKKRKMVRQKNINSAMHSLRSWDDREICPDAKPMFVPARTVAEAVAA